MPKPKQRVAFSFPSPQAAPFLLVGPIRDEAEDGSPPAPAFLSFLSRAVTDELDPQHSVVVVLAFESETNTTPISRPSNADSAIEPSRVLAVHAKALSLRLINSYRPRSLLFPSTPAAATA
jgi:hypothetical protein